MSFESDYLTLRKKRKKEDENSNASENKSSKTTKSKNSKTAFTDEYLSLREKRLNDKTVVSTTDEDIAPVKTTKGGNKDSIFKSGGFSDGVDGVGDFFVDLGQTVAGTVGDLGIGIVKGAGRLVEGVIDLGAYGMANIAEAVDKNSPSSFGKENSTSEKVREWAKTSYVDELSQGAEDYVDQYSVLGDKADAVSEGLGQIGAIILTGGAAGSVAGAAGLSGAAASAAATATTTSVMGLSSFGSGMSEAYSAGATDEEATKYGLMKGAVDAGSELLFGGLGKTVKALGLSRGISSLDDAFAKKLSSKLTQKLTNETVKNIAGNTVEYAVKSGAEGLEEVIAGVGTAAAKKLTYMSDEELTQLIEDEDLLEQFAVGAITSGIAQSGIVPGMTKGSYIEANKTGADFITGQTINEQKVIDKEVESRIAEKEADGTKLTKKEKAAIEEQVASDLEKGYISTDTIESVLGGETYEQYKTITEKENALKNEIERLENMPNEQITVKQKERLSEARKELENIESASNKTDLKAKLNEEVFELAKADRLSESYNEKARRGQAFEADVTKYDTKQQETIQKAIDSGILNNSNRTHEFVDMIAKISADKGVLFDFTNNEKLKESGFAIDGKTVNGYVTKDGITLNINARKSLNSVVGHEITHVLEGTELYTELQNTLFEYAKSKNDYQGRHDSLAELYKDVDGANVNSELTADLIGDYLFTDEDFVRKLSTEHRNIFQKIYDEVKYLLKVATAGSKEARELEKVKRAFDKAYKESGKANTDTKYSISEIVDENNNSYGIGVILDSTLLDNLSPKERSEIVKEYVKELGGKVFSAYDNNGSAVNITIAKSNARFKNRNGKSIPVNNDLTRKYIDNETKQEAIALIDELITTAKFDDSKSSLYSHGWLDNNGSNNWEYWTTYIQDKNKTIWEATLNIANSANGEKILYDISPIKKAGQSVKSDTSTANKSIAPLPGNVNTKFSLSSDSDGNTSTENQPADPDIRYSLSDTEYLNAVETGDTETAQKMVDEAAHNNGYTVKAYHGTGRSDRVGTVFRADRATSGPMVFFTDDKDIADRYSRDKADTSLSYDEEYDNYYTQFRVNRNGKSISVPELWNYLSISERNRIKEQAKHIKFDDDLENIIVDQSEQHGNGSWDAYTLNMHKGNALEALADTWLESGDLYNREADFLEVLNLVGITDAEYRDPDARYEKVYDTWLKIQNPFDTANANQSFYDSLSKWIESNDMSFYEKESHYADMWDKNNETPESWLERLADDIEDGRTNAWTVIPDFVTDYLKEQGYDGIKDNGGKGGGTGHTVWIPFSSEQIKSAEAVTRDNDGNIIPLSERFDKIKTDIRYSLSNEGEQTTLFGNYNVYGKDISIDSAPVKEDVAKNTSIASEPEPVENIFPDDYAPMKEEEAAANDRERLESIGDFDAPPEKEAPYQGESLIPDDPFEDRDMKEVGNRKVKAYMYENPDVKPFFQEAARVMLGDLERTIRGERGFNSEAYYNTNGEQAFYGMSRTTTSDIAELLDDWNYTYAEIEAGLKAIIEDHGQENNACSKRIEFMLNDRLKDGFKDVFGYQNPPNQDYINLLNEKQITEYSEEAFNSYMESLNAFAPVADDIGPTQEYEAIKPKPEKLSAEEEQWTKNKTARATVKPKGKQRKWPKTSIDSEPVNHKILLEDLDVSKITYQPISNAKTLGNANAMLDRYGYEKSINYFDSQFYNKQTTLDDLVLGERLIQEAIKKGDNKIAGELIQNVAILGTELGQMVQALSIIQRLTPEGQLKMLKKIIDRGKTKGDKAFEGVEITQDMIDHILETYNKDGSFDVERLTSAVEDVKEQIAGQMKVTKREQANAWRYLAMLGNPKTHIRNTVSNVAMKGTMAVKDVIAGAIEDIAPIENRTKTLRRSTDTVKDFAKKTALEMKDVISGNSKYSEQASIKSKRNIFKNKILNGVYEFNSEWLSKEDWWFSKSAFEKALSGFLTANGIKTEADIKNNPEIVEKGKVYATEQSQIATFRQYSWVANKIRDIESKNAVAGAAVGAILPFKKTPINIAKTGLNYSPLGFAKTLTYDIAQVKNGNMEASELVDHLAQNVTGTALALVGYMLAKSGLLNGAGEDDEEGEYDYQLGEQAYSLNIGGNTYSLSWLTPAAMPLFVGANAYEQLVEGKEWNGNVILESLGQTLDPLSEMSFLSSLDSVLSSYESGMGKFFGIGESMLQNYATQFIPTLASQAASVIDDTKRSTKASGDSEFKFVEETTNKLAYKIPFLRQTLEPSIDIWGNEVKQNDNVFARAFETFISPYTRKENIATEIDEELKTLYGETGDSGLIPDVPYNYVNYDGEKYNMSDKEYTEFKKTYGQNASNLLEDLFNTTTYKNATSEEKADMVNDVYDYARDEAKKKFLATQGIEYTNAKKDGEEYYKTGNIVGAIENDMSAEEYELYSTNPGKHAVAKSVGGYKAYNTYSSELYDIKADKDENEKSISGSRKEKVIEYINSLDADYGEKIILFKSEYNADNTYNHEIIDYLNNREDITYEEMEAILKELGFTVDSEGNIYWD